jgi:aspartate/tyrosine/aromatic aminotransferase
MIESEENKEYLPIEGLAAFNKATAELLLGAGHPAIQEARCGRAAGCRLQTHVYQLQALAARGREGAFRMGAPAGAPVTNVFHA